MVKRLTCTMFENSTVECKDTVEYISCACGCGQKLAKYNKWGYERKFIDGHFWKGKTHSKATKRKMSKNQKGEKNSNWLGDNVSYAGLHCWVKRHFPKPDKCHLCLKVPPKDLACITGIYNRELRNWAYLCQRCHCKWDNTGARNKITRTQNLNM